MVESLVLIQGLLFCFSYQMTIGLLEESDWVLCGFVMVLKESPVERYVLLLVLQSFEVMLESVTLFSKKLLGLSHLLFPILLFETIW